MMKKSILKGFLVGSLLIVGTVLAGSWTDPATGITWEYFIDNGTAVLQVPVNLEDTVGDITVPNMLGGHPVTCLPELTFDGCKALTSVVIPAGVTRICYRAFDRCHSLKSVRIPEGVTSIDYRAFGDCRSLPSVTIPASVAQIDGSVFDGCSSLQAINVSKGSKSYLSRDGVLFDITGQSLIAVPGQRSGNYSIPEGVTSINEYAFSSCKFLTSISLPASVKSIGDTAFYYCNNLTNLVFAGDAPEVDRFFFMSLSDTNNCAVTVWKGTKGWDDDQDGRWHGLRLTYRTRKQ